MDSAGNSKYIWDFFVERIGNEYGVAALMGNLYAESGLYCDRVQGDIPYSNYSKEYTAKIDSGAITEYQFVNNGPNGGGYGLAQWTWQPRKQALYDMWKTHGFSSIGSRGLACEYLWYELQTDYNGVLNVLRSANSIREASDKVLHDFENPADQSAAVEATRACFGQYYYNTYHGTEPDPNPDPEPDIPPVNPDPEPGIPVKRSKLPFLLLWAASRR